jgi:hypothetical protein
MAEWRVEAIGRKAGSHQTWLFRTASGDARVVHSVLRNDWDIINVERKPGLLFAASETAQVLMLLYLYATAIATWFFTDDLDIIWPVVSVAACAFLIAVSRYFMVVYPWERETRRLETESRRRNAIQKAKRDD